MSKMSDDQPIAFPIPDAASVPSPLGDAGRQAVSNGAQFENDVASRLLGLHYLQVKALPVPHVVPFFIHHWRSPYVSPYGTGLVPDFYVWHPEKWPNGLLIECKWQETPGSADLKLHYHIAALKMTGLRCILVMLGPGFSRSARIWCEAQEDTLLTVITSYEQWIVRLNRGLL